MAQNPYEEPWWIRIQAYLLAVTGLVGVLFIVYAVISPVFYSEEQRAEIVAEREAAEADRLTDWEEQMKDRAIGIVGRLNYVQDSRTGICFAVRAVGHFSMLATVPCEAVPVDLLEVTE